jgi:hypothetical protein
MMSLCMAAGIAAATVACDEGDTKTPIGAVVPAGNLASALRLRWRLVNDNRRTTSCDDAQVQDIRINVEDTDTGTVREFIADCGDGNYVTPRLAEGTYRVTFEALDRNGDVAQTEVIGGDKTVTLVANSTTATDAVTDVSSVRIVIGASNHVATIHWNLVDDNGNSIDCPSDRGHSPRIRLLIDNDGTNKNCEFACSKDSTDIELSNRSASVKAVLVFRGHVLAQSDEETISAGRGHVDINLELRPQ